MSHTNMYLVTEGSTSRIVVAKSAAKALKHCLNDRFVVTKASTFDVAALMASGVVIESAIVEESEEPGKE
jgi:tryptophan synthase alpha subunit